MTVTVDAGMTLAALQAELARGGQWLPVDPPFPERTTISDLIAHNLNGPRRFGYGTIRDYAIGMSIRLADGRVIKSGGKVVKNVAGYDLQKLFIGAGGSLGAIVEVTFKLRPVPEMECFVQKACASLDQAGTVIDAILESAVVPAVLDLHSVKTNSPTVILGFDGAREDVEWQLGKSRELGFSGPASLEYEKIFQSNQPETIGKLSVLPAKLLDAIRASGPGEFVARAGNGILYKRGLPPATKKTPVHLFQRAKELFDPQNRLAPLPA